jgi:hypothetical protein
METGRERRRECASKSNKVTLDGTKKRSRHDGLGIYINIHTCNYIFSAQNGPSDLPYVPAGLKCARYAGSYCGTGNQTPPMSYR